MKSWGRRIDEEERRKLEVVGIKGIDMFWTMLDHRIILHAWNNESEDGKRKGYQEQISTLPPRVPNVNYSQYRKYFIMLWDLGRSSVGTSRGVYHTLGFHLPSSALPPLKVSSTLNSVSESHQAPGCAFHDYEDLSEIFNTASK